MQEIYGAKKPAELQGDEFIEHFQEGFLMRFIKVRRWCEGRELREERSFRRPSPATRAPSRLGCSR